MIVQLAEPLRLAASTAANFSPFLGALGLAAGLLLIVALSAKEMVRAYGGPQTSRWMRAFNLAVVPLLVVFGVAIVERVVPLLISP